MRDDYQHWACSDTRPLEEVSAGQPARLSEFCHADALTLKPWRSSNNRLFFEMGEGQLRKSHAPQLVLTGEALDAVIAFEAGDTAPERVHRQMIHQLREYELPFVHGRLPAAVADGEAGGSRESGSSR